MSADKSDILKKMRESEAIYVLMSDCTRLPFVVCDPEHFYIKKDWRCTLEEIDRIGGM